MSRARDIADSASTINALDNVTASGAELNILDGVTSTTAELNILDGVTSTATEINKLDALSRGSLIYGNASAETAILTKGSADQVLTSDGTDIAWADADGGGLQTYLAKVEVSSDVSTVTLDNAAFGNTTYDYLIIKCDNVSISSGGAIAMYYRDSTGNLNASRNNPGTGQYFTRYNFALRQNKTTTEVNHGADSQGSFYSVIGSSDSSGTTLAGQGDDAAGYSRASAYIKIFHRNDSWNTHAESSFMVSTTTMSNMDMKGVWTGKAVSMNITLAGVQFYLPSGGNFKSGSKFKLYGVKESV